MYVLINFVCMKTDEIKTEIHPLGAFLPARGKAIDDGKFPAET